MTTACAAATTARCEAGRPWPGTLVLKGSRAPAQYATSTRVGQTLRQGRDQDARSGRAGWNCLPMRGLRADVLLCGERAALRESCGCHGGPLHGESTHRFCATDVVSLHLQLRWTRPFLGRETTSAVGRGGCAPRSSRLNPPPHSDRFCPVLMSSPVIH